MKAYALTKFLPPGKNSSQKALTFSCLLDTIISIVQTGREYVIDCAFPTHFDAKAKQWDGPCTWEDVMIQRGKREMLRLVEQ